MTDETDDEWVYTTEIVTQEQVDSLRRLLALPWVEGFHVELGDEDGTTTMGIPPRHYG